MKSSLVYVVFQTLAASGSSRHAGAILILDFRSPFWLFWWTSVLAALSLNADIQLPMTSRYLRDPLG